MLECFFFFRCTYLRSPLTATDMAAEVLLNIEEVILVAIGPDAIIVPIGNSLLEERRNSILAPFVTLIVLAYTLTEHAEVVATRTSLPEIRAAADGGDAAAGCVACDAERVAVHEGGVAVGGTVGGEEAFEFGGASGCGTRAYADEHGPAGAVTAIDADALRA